MAPTRKRRAPLVIDEVCEFEADADADDVAEVPVSAEPDARAWADRHTPVSGHALVMSNRKISEVRAWMRAAVEGVGARMLVLAGPPGSGKSSVVRALAAEVGLDVAEWSAPAGCRGVRLVESLGEFFVGVRYPSLVGGGGRRLLLVEDLPANARDVVEKRDLLRDVMWNAARFSRHPTVVILSDSDKARAHAARTIGLDLLESELVASIKVPPVTDINLSNAVKRVLDNEGFSISASDLGALVASCCGDVRAAVNGLQFFVGNRADDRNGTAVGLSGLDAMGPHANGRDASRKRKTRSAKRARPVVKRPVVKRPAVDLIAGVGRDASLGTYHAVSKILNNKRLDGGESKYDPEQVLDDAHAEPASFLAFLHQNYPPFFGNIEDAAEALGTLSDCDRFLPWMQDDLSRTYLADCAASVAVRGFLQFNRNPIRTGWRPIRGPESYSIAEEGNEFLHVSRQRFANFTDLDVRKRSFVCEVVPYAEILSHSPLKQWGGEVKFHQSSRIASAVDTAEVAMVEEELVDRAKDEQPAPMVEAGDAFGTEMPVDVLTSLCDAEDEINDDWAGET